MRGRKSKPLTIQQFNAEWDNMREKYKGQSSQSGWHKYVIDNFDSFSEGAIRFMADDNRIFFGDWLRQASVHRVFEWDVLSERKKNK